MIALLASVGCKHSAVGTYVAQGPFKMTANIVLNADHSFTETMGGATLNTGQYEVDDNRIILRNARVVTPGEPDSGDVNATLSSDGKQLSVGDLIFVKQ